MYRKIAVLSIMAVMLLCCMAPARGSSGALSINNTTAAQQSNVTVVSVGVYVLNIGALDISTGTYTMDFYLDFLCNRPCNPTNFGIVNGEPLSTNLIYNSSTEKFYRVQAQLDTNINLRDYPFDQHTLPIIIEDQLSNNQTQVYAANDSDSGIDPNATLVGWRLIGWNTTVRNHFYSAYNQSYSDYVFNVNIGRNSLSAAIKIFMPVIFIVIVGLMSLLIEEKKELWTRIGISTSALIATVMFHVAITSGLPEVDYLTFADQFMIVTYISLSLVVLSSVLLLKWNDKDHRVFRLALYGIPLLTVACYVALFMFLR